MQLPIAMIAYEHNYSSIQMCAYLAFVASGYK